ncbi:hypothetical protein WJX81_006145 [Elliptochloris bilobata]|uniref:Uncharacterized protein n=1 Tax=Elliptochloris bilobata TaxID=381761 RepID=A0AAW1RIV6_9CHLO
MFVFRKQESGYCLHSLCRASQQLPRQRSTTAEREALAQAEAHLQKAGVPPNARAAVRGWTVWWKGNVAYRTRQRVYCEPRVSGKDRTYTSLPDVARAFARRCLGLDGGLPGCGAC